MPQRLSLHFSDWRNPAPNTPENTPNRRNQGSWVNLVNWKSGTVYHWVTPKNPRETMAATTDATTSGANRFIEKFAKTICAANTAPATGAL